MIDCSTSLNQLLNCWPKMNHQHTLIRRHESLSANVFHHANISRIDGFFVAVLIAVTLRQTVEPGHRVSQYYGTRSGNSVPRKPICSNDPDADTIFPLQPSSRHELTPTSLAFKAWDPRRHAAH